MKTYIKPCVSTEYFELLNMIAVGSTASRVGGNTISGGEQGLDWHKIL